MDITFLITGHVPYLRQVGRAPVGEEQLHRTVAEGLLPLLNLLHELQTANFKPHVGLALSPILLEQLADPLVQKHFVTWMQSWIDRAERDVQRWENDGVSHQAYLANFYVEWGRNALLSFEERYQRSLVAALRDLCAVGVVEPLATPATYAYLPLLGSGPSLRAQLELGVLNVTRHLGRPSGLWLPGCGISAGLLPHIVATGLSYVVVDPSTIQQCPLPGWLLPHQLAALPIDEAIGTHVWSWELGYPGDPLYRDARRDAHSGLAYWAGGADGATPYDPYHAFRRAHEHAAHFVTLLHQHAARDNGPLVLPLDLALLGTQWFEGIAWLRSVLMQTTSGHVTSALPQRALRVALTKSILTLNEGSWATGSDHSPWQGIGTLEYWNEIRTAEERLVELTQQLSEPYSTHERLLNQAARELLLAQSSDWPALLSSGDDVAEATRRWRTHLRRCTRLCDLVLRPSLDYESMAALEQIEEQDNPFPELNYRIFEVGENRDE